MKCGAGRQKGYSEQLPAAELPLEFVMNALRLSEGMPADLYQARTGLLLKALQPVLEQARRQDLLANDRMQLRATEQGLLFLNQLPQLFCPEPDRQATLFSPSPPSRPPLCQQMLSVQSPETILVTHRRVHLLPAPVADAVLSRI
ncbi:MAG: hypothetical protein OXC07_03450 [Kistimonas sp.]|nr:hypothetical protein [Kistimonas sp.]